MGKAVARRRRVIEYDADGIPLHGADGGLLSDYERQRLLTMRENESILSALLGAGLGRADARAPAPAPTPTAVTAGAGVAIAAPATAAMPTSIEIETVRPGEREG